MSGCYAAAPSKEWPSPPDCSAGCPKGYTCDDGVCSGGNPLKLDFDIETFPVSGRLTVDGDAPTPTGYCEDDCTGDALYSDGHVVMSFATTEERAAGSISWFDTESATGTRSHVAIDCSATDGAFKTRLPAGNYRIEASEVPHDRLWDDELSRSNFPTNARVELTRGFKVNGPVDKLRWNVSPVKLSGTLAVDEIYQMDRDCYGEFQLIEFVSHGTRAAVSRIDPDDQSFSVRLVPDTYRVRAVVGHCRMTVVDSLSVRKSTDELAWQVHTVPISAKVTFADPVVEENACQSLGLEFLGEDGSKFVLGDTVCFIPSFDIKMDIPPGTYRVLGPYNPPGELASGKLLLQSRLVVDARHKDFAWKVSMVQVSGKVSLNGAASCGRPTVTFVGDDGARLSQTFDCNASGGAFSMQVAPGTYSVFVNGTGIDGAVQVRTGLTIERSVDGLALDVKTVPIAGSIKIDGKPPAVSDACEPRFGDLVEVSFEAANGTVFHGWVLDGSDGSWSINAVPGTYRVTATRHDASQSSFPLQTITLQDALTIP